MGSNPPKLELDLGSQEPLSATAAASTSDRPPIPKIEVPPGSEGAIDPNSPPHDIPTGTSQESEQLREHKDNIPLEDMTPSSGTAVAGSTATASAPEGRAAPLPSTAGPTDASQPYIGPAKTGSTDDGPPGPGGEPAVYTTLCVANTENRHRWKITNEYLRRRDEPVPNNTSTTPSSSSPQPPGDELLDVNIGQLKRLLHADWRPDWEPKPMEPTQIRLISMGEQLQDDKTLRDHRFKIDGPPRPILLSVRRPIEDDQDVEADAPRKSHGGSTGPDGEPRSRMCCCSVM